MTGVESSIEGIQQEHSAYPDLKLANGAAYDDLASQDGTFPVVVSLEAVEHVDAPRHYSRTIFELLSAGDTAMISTSYHGYWKNVAPALIGRMNRHFTAMYDNGYIKFRSIDTRGELLRKAGFVDNRFERVGRI